MTGCILGSQYIPSIEYFAHWRYHGTVWMEACEHYQKRTWRNKTAILGPDNPLVLTVPLRKGKHQQMQITNVQISYDEPWQKIHLNSLKTAYGKTAFFEEIVPGLEDLYTTLPQTLWELNFIFTRYITSLMPDNWDYDLTTSYTPLYSETMKDVRRGVPAGYASIEVENELAYPQVQRLAQTHQPNLCILDALCHLGPDTKVYLDRYGAKLYDTIS